VRGIERTIGLVDGTTQPGEEAARETVAYRKRLHPPPAPLPPIAAIGYQAMNTVPENWIRSSQCTCPGAAARSRSSAGPCPGILDAPVSPPVQVRPRTTLLRPGLDAGQPYFVHEEEVPRVGTRLSLTFNRTRWYDGRVVVWLGARRTTGRGEASGGLDCDRVVNTP
jgi:hypothetical protein